MSHNFCVAYMNYFDNVITQTIEYVNTDTTLAEAYIIFASEFCGYVPEEGLFEQFTPEQIIEAVVSHVYNTDSNLNIIALD